MLFVFLDASETTLDEVLVANQWKTLEELKNMSEDEKRNIIIAELNKLSHNDSFFKSLTTKQLMVIAKQIKGTHSERNVSQCLIMSCF